MEIYPASTYGEVEQLVADLRHPSTVLQFRGQKCDDCGWTLRPALAREVNTPAELIHRQKELLTEFQSRITHGGLQDRLLVNNHPRHHQAEWEMLQQAQHYELPTLLMDFSLDWKRSLYFAVHDPSMDDHDGQLWIYQAPIEVLMGDNSDSSDTDYFRYDPLSLTSPIIANPAFYWVEGVDEQIAAQRRFLQMARFLVQSPEESLIPMETNPRFSPYLVKVIIPAAAKKDIRNRLLEDGLSMDYLYYKKDPVIEAIVTGQKDIY